MTSDDAQPPPQPEASEVDPPPSDVDAEYADLPPWSIWYAVRLMWAGAGLSLLGIVLSLLTIDDARRTIAADLRDQHKYSQHDVDTLSQNLLASTVIGSVLAALMWLWMARTNGAGKKWARALATTLGGLNILWFALSFSTEGITVPQLVLAGISVLLSVAILALIWHSDSSDYYWFKSRRGRPAG
jgi:hypothetical protein